MKVIKLFLGLFLITSLFFSGCKNVQAIKTGELAVSAAASLKVPLEEIAKQYEKQTSISVNLNFGSSGSLQKQIEEGAPVDLFISAGKSQVDTLIKKEVADKSSYSELLTNSLVLIVSNNYNKNINSIDSLKDKDIKLALGEAATVPAGQYSKEFLEKTNLWNSFKDKIVYAKDVRSVLNYVEKGEAEAGIVYSSDAANLSRSYIACKIPEAAHSPIIYPMVIIENSKNKDSAKSFAEFLQGAQAKEIFKKFNFNVKDN